MAGIFEGVKCFYSLASNQLITLEAAFDHAHGFAPTMNENRKIYIISSSLGMLKVGVSVSPETRMIDLQTNREDKLTLTWSSGFIPQENVFRMEKAAHRELSKFQHRGEWFKCEPALAIAACEEVIKRSYEPKKKNPQIRLSVSLPKESMALLLSIQRRREEELGCSVPLAKIVREAIKFASDQSERGVA